MTHHSEYYDAEFLKTSNTFYSQNHPFDMFHLRGTFQKITVNTPTSSASSTLDHTTLIWSSGFLETKNVLGGLK